MKYIKLSVMALCSIIAISSCKKDDDNAPSQTALSVSATAPQGIENVKQLELTATFKESNTGKLTTAKFDGDKLDISLPIGVYDISVEGTMQYVLDGNESDAGVRGYQESVSLTNPQSTLSIGLFIHNETAGFVLQEVFYSGTLTPENKKYWGDTYFRIYNNSDEVLYADGLVIAHSEFTTNDKQDYRPDIMSEAVAVGSVILIPGSGQEHPVQPGASFIVAETGINHKEYNSNSFDLSKADFEMYFEDADDVDNPAVPNAEVIYNNSAISDQGTQAFLLARLEGGKDAFLTNQKYDYAYDFVFGDMVVPFEESAYKIPNAWVIDAVNVSNETDFQWIVTNPALDMGWTYNSTDGGDSRYGKSVRRKVLSVSAEGRDILKDTNNSSLDFDTAVRPSLAQ